MEIVIVVLFLGGMAALFAFLIRRNQKIKKNGIEAEAVICHASEQPEETDEDGNTTMHMIYRVKYRNREGEEVEARLGDEPRGLKVGDQVKIKYLPEKPKFVVLDK